MKRYVLFGLLVAAVCTPLFFVAFLLTAANVPALDKLTMAMPHTIRAAVAELALGSGGGAANKKTHDRVLKLDPQNDQARSGGCSGNYQVGTGSCAVQVLGLDTAGAERLNTLGLKQEQGGDPCSAEDTFTKANTAAGGGRSEYLRNMGRAAYECGRYAYSSSEFSAAEDDDAKDLAAHPEDADDINPDLEYEREWLSLAYTATRQPQLANEACLRAHTGWKACRCILKDQKPVCSEIANRSSR